MLTFDEMGRRDYFSGLVLVLAKRTGTAIRPQRTRRQQHTANAAGNPCRGFHYNKRFSRPEFKHTICGSNSTRRNQPALHRRKSRTHRRDHKHNKPDTDRLHGHYRSRSLGRKRRRLAQCGIPSRLRHQPKFLCLLHLQQPFNKPRSHCKRWTA